MQPRLHLNVSVARSCFVKCRGCYNHFGRSSELVDSKELLAFLAFAAQAGATRVTVCGGDPLSRPDILDLLQGIKELGLLISLDTVGTPLLGDTDTIFYGRTRVPAIDASRLARLTDLVGIPLDGPTHDSIATFRTGRRNLFAEQMTILSILENAGASVCVNTVVHSGNIDTLGEIASHIQRFVNIIKWQLFQFMPTGPLGFRNKHEFLVTADAFTAACNRLRTQAAAGLSGRIEVKSNADRKGRYLLVDSEGLAWIPRLSRHEGWNDADATDQRIVLGDIRNPSDHAKILAIAMDPTRRV